MRIISKRMVVLPGIYSACLSVTFVIGSKIDISAVQPFASFTLHDLIRWLVLSILIFIVTLGMILFLLRRSWSFLVYKHKTGIWLFSFAVILVCWLPYFLIYYPGNLSADSFSTLSQISGSLPLGNHHPVLFTLFVKAFYSAGLLFGDPNFGIAFYSVIQMLIVATVLSYCIYWFAEKRVPRYVLVLSAAFFALNPVIAMYSFTMWKDVLFGGWMLLTVLFLYDIAESGGELLDGAKGLIKLSVLCLLVAFFRNNGIYIVCIVLGTVILCYRKKMKRLLPVFSGLLIAIVLIQGPVYNAFGIEKGPFAESLGIPLQQISYTVKYGGELTAEQEEFLNELMPAEAVKNAYQPETVDAIKFNPQFNRLFLEENKARFIKTWLEILPNHFVGYMKAYLMETQGYYHIGTSNWLCYYGLGQESNGSYYNTDLVQRLFHLNLQDTIKGLIEQVEYLYSIAAMVWLALFLMILLIIRKQMKFILALMPLLVLWLTLMAAAPTYCEFRYMFSFLLAVPFLVITLFSRQKNEASHGAK